MPLGIVSKASEMLRVATRPNGRFAIETNRKPSLDIFASGLSCLTFRNWEFLAGLKLKNERICRMMNILYKRKLRYTLKIFLN